MLLRSPLSFPRVNPPNAVLCLGLGTRLTFGIGLRHVRAAMASQCEPFAWYLCAAETGRLPNASLNNMPPPPCLIVEKGLSFLRSVQEFLQVFLAKVILLALFIRKMNGFLSATQA
ncbi:hypothetical protein TNCV_352211 [Trichonephila clavipes]|nr:hypothetical protein TNCV_352211 [Trichonephila clavipes]